MAYETTRLELTIDDADRLWLRIGDVPVFQLLPAESIVDCLNRVGDKFERQVDYPTKGDDPWARDYARALWSLASRLKEAPVA